MNEEEIKDAVRGWSAASMFAGMVLALGIAAAVAWGGWWCWMGGAGAGMSIMCVRCFQDSLDKL